MDKLADAVIEAILYIELASVNDDRADSDVRALESLFYLLGKTSTEEKEALHAALERARLAASEDLLRDPHFFSTLQAIEEGILGEGEGDAL